MEARNAQLFVHLVSLVLTRRGLRVIAVGVLGLTLVGVSVGTLMRMTSVPQVDSVPYVTLDPRWLTDKEWLLAPNPETGELRTIQDSYLQMKLWLENDDSSRGQMGVMVEERYKEALRYQGQAAIFINNPTHPTCGRQPQEICYQSFAHNLIDELQGAPNPSARLTALTKYLALNEARFNTAENLGIPTDTLALQILKKFEFDLSLYYDRGTANGLSKAAQDAEAAAATQEEEPQ